jgi:hypothetical protein
MSLLLISWGPVKSKQGQGARFWPMARQSPTRRKSRGDRSRAEQGSRSKDKDQDRGQDQLMATSKLDSPVS